MPASPAQMAANRANASRSTGPKTAAGKEAARRNAMTHGLTGRGVVIPGEDEQEVALRVGALEEQLAPAGDVLGVLLVRQVAIASIRVERAFRQETALAAERMRRAGDVFDDGRQVLAAEILAELPIDPATARRRLLAAPEGVDALVGRLRALREKADPRSFAAWDDTDGDELDRCLGNTPGQTPLSRAGLLTRGIVYDSWEGIDPAEHAGLDFEARLRWAVGAIRDLIAAEVAALAAHRDGLDLDRARQSRAEASERALVDLGKDGTALRRYAGAAERSMVRLLKELKDLRRDAERAATVAPPPPVAPLPIPPPPMPAAVTEVLTTVATHPVVRAGLRDGLASFCPGPRRRPRPGVAPLEVPMTADASGTFVPITAGVAPLRPVPPRP